MASSSKMSSRLVRLSYSRTIPTRPIPAVQALARALNNSSSCRAAVATSPAPAPAAPAATTRTTPKRPVTRTIPISTRATTKPSKTASTIATASAPSAPPPEDRFDYGDFPAVPEINDYATLSRPSPTAQRESLGPTASPPLTNTPSASYQSLLDPSAPSQSSTSTDISSGSIHPVEVIRRTPDIPGEAVIPPGNDWGTSFQGLSSQPFDKDVAKALLKPLEPDDVEVKPGKLCSVFDLTKGDKR